MLEGLLGFSAFNQSKIVRKKAIIITLRNEEQVKWFEDDRLNRILTQSNRKFSQMQLKTQNIKKKRHTTK